MNKLRNGWTLQDLAETVIELCGHVEKLDAQVTNLRGGWTDIEIKKASFKEWPQIGDIIYRFNSQGQIIEQPWANSEKQQGIKAFLGIFRSREGAELQKKYLLLDDKELY
jgi:hypothetical protein